MAERTPIKREVSIQQLPDRKPKKDGSCEPLGSENYPVEPLDVYAKDGDLIISLPKRDEEGRRNFRVSSRVLSASSPVFEAMFAYDSPFEEGKKLQEWRFGMDPVVMELEDSIKAMELFLQIIFHQNQSLPRRIKLYDFAELAQFADKYDCQNAVQLWADKWKRCYADVSRFCESRHQLTASLWLMIGWAFGFQQRYSKASRTLMLDGMWRNGKLGMLVKPEKDTMEWIYLFEELPQAVIRDIKAKMVKSRKLFVDLLPCERKRFIEAELGSLCVCNRTKYPDAMSKELCHHWQIGSLERSAAKVLEITAEWDFTPDLTQEHEGDQYDKLLENRLTMNGAYKRLAKYIRWALRRESRLGDDGPRGHANCTWAKHMLEEFMDSRKFLIFSCLSDFPSRSEKFNLSPKNMDEDELANENIRENEPEDEYSDLEDPRVFDPEDHAAHKRFYAKVQAKIDAGRAETQAYLDLWGCGDQDEAPPVEEVESSEEEDSEDEDDDESETDEDL
ncbi:hypothetical protein BJ508DRAFT_417702 [Ascobolus immersus RN42]|uniref:BTB domain-containing protein n=1 Tax=Ascobolus immersus RN42 TaxID=1160509 RepID=A0A3N4HSA7_ASCIM|nr:hypothetical protein BJ508DRAFT_417702 [Ascobolus immersus RN42]